MYLHLGQSVVVPFRDVVGIFDLDNTTSSIHTRKFLERAEKEGRVVDVLNRIQGGQVFITCCEDDKLEGLREGKTFHVRAGALI